MRKIRKGDLVKCIEDSDGLTVGNYYLVEGSYFANVNTKGVNIKCDNGLINGYLTSRFVLSNRKIIRDKTIDSILK